MKEIIYPEESYAIMGACFNVYKDKGAGFLEPVYQECLTIEFEYQKIPNLAQPELILYYRGEKLNKTYRPDFVCYDKIIVEIKAVEKIVDENEAQILNYLYASGFKLGILVNFGHYPKLEYKRIALTEKRR
ncbi:MAG: GxxExxY protein [Candidatus Cloacimonetes bacterium]|nr:GxxExxY protein [Candidatus Cloacimonadota bacterium]MBL7149105.1 GxxExxY protein [Candidatus Cloacimonadota bacterium]